MNKIKILCPPRKCAKCKKMIAAITEMISQSEYEANIQIIDSIDELSTYKTWVLPALVIKNILVARAYIPDRNTLGRYISGKIEK
jgi:hypothetical protein